MSECISETVIPRNIANMVDIAVSTGRTFVKTLRHDTYPAIEPSQWVATGDFTGRVVLITGASRGIGRAMASSYARAGVSGLVLVARSAGALDTVEKEVRAVHPGGELKVLKLSVDVADEKSVSEAARAVKETFDRLDIVVNNAGVLENFTLIGQSDPSAWWSTWEVNVKGTYLVTHAFLDLLLESSSGGMEGRKTVVNVTSIGAHLTSEGGSAYQTGKLAILRLTEFLVVEYGARGLLAVSLDPGGVLTDMGAGLPQQFHASLVDTPELAANTLVWLTRDRKEWLAGREVVVNWDVEELDAKKEEVVKGDKLKVRLVV